MNGNAHEGKKASHEGGVSKGRDPDRKRLKLHARMGDSFPMSAVGEACGECSGKFVFVTQVPSGTCELSEGKIASWDWEGVS